MNSVNFKTVKNFIKIFTRGFLFVFFFFVQVRVHAEVVGAEITAPSTETKVVAPTSAVITKPTEMSVSQKDQELVQAIRKAVRPVEPKKEIVILNTELGFVPDKIRVKKGEAYKVHIVNINMKEKNVSFLMDSFTQSHNTVFGIEKTFIIEPQIEGIYSFQCPETGIQGQLVVVNQASNRKATADEEE